MTTQDVRAEYRTLPPAARVWSTTHPHVLYWTAAVECVVFAGLGGWLMSRSVVGGLVVILVGIVAALFTAWPAHWSEKHPDLAARAIDLQRERRNQLARRHPALFVVVVPLVIAADAAARFNRYRHHPSTLDWLVPAAVGLAVGLAVGIILVRRARRSRTA